MEADDFLTELEEINGKRFDILDEKVICAWQILWENDDHGRLTFEFS